MEITSYFIPCSKNYPSWIDFKHLDAKYKVATVAITIFATFFLLTFPALRLCIEKFARNQNGTPYDSMLTTYNKIKAKVDLSNLNPVDAYISSLESSELGRYNCICFFLSIENYLQAYHLKEYVEFHNARSSYYKDAYEDSYINSIEFKKESWAFILHLLKETPDKTGISDIKSALERVFTFFGAEIKEDKKDVVTMCRELFIPLIRLWTEME